jgi:hypothetical protein
MKYIPRESPSVLYGSVNILYCLLTIDKHLKRFPLHDDKEKEKAEVIGECLLIISALITDLMQQIKDEHLVAVEPDKVSVVKKKMKGKMTITELIKKLNPRSG